MDSPVGSFNRQVRIPWEKIEYGFGDRGDLGYHLFAVPTGFKHANYGVELSAGAFQAKHRRLYLIGIQLRHWSASLGQVQRFSGGTSRSASSMCRPQPAHVVLWHWEQGTGRHMRGSNRLSSSSIVYPPGYRPVRSVLQTVELRS